MFKNIKRVVSILILISFLFSNFNIQSFSQTLSTSLNITVQRDNSGVYKITRNSISIIWNPIEDAVLYEVYAAFSNSQVDFQTVTQNTYCDITGLKSATVYKITVVAKNEDEQIITSQSIYVITEFKLYAQPEPDPEKEEDVPLGSGGEHPKLLITFNKINVSDDFQPDIGFRGYNIFVGKSQTASDANQYYVDNNTNEIYKYQKENNITIPIKLYKEGVQQFAQEINQTVNMTVYDKYDGIDTYELVPGTMYYILMNPKMDSTKVIYKPLTNIACPTLMQVSAAKIGEIEKDGKTLALVRVQWRGVDPGNYKQDEIRYRAYYATSANELPRDNLPPQNIFATTSYNQNEAYIPGLSMTTKYYYIRVEAIFADGTRIPSALIKVSVTELGDIPPTPKNCRAETISQTEIEVSFDKPVSDDSSYVYQIWISTEYKDVLDASGNPTVYKLVYTTSSYDPNTDGFLPSDLILDGTRYRYKISNLLPNTVYYFKIRIINTTNQKKSDFSLIFVGTTKPVAILNVPPVDDNFVRQIVTSETGIRIYVYQDDLLSRVHQAVVDYVSQSAYFSGNLTVSEKVYYQVYVCESSWDEKNVKIYFELPSENISNYIDISNLKSNTPYYIRFKVRVYLDKDYLSEFSKAYVALTKPQQVPPTISQPEIPKNFMIAPEDDAVTQTSVKLRWDTKPGQSYVILQTSKPLDSNNLSIDEVKDYFVKILRQKVEIYRQVSDSAFVVEQVVYDVYSQNSPVGAKIYIDVTTPVTFKNLAPNTLYYFSIKAIENGRESLWGSIAVTTSSIEKPENLMIISRDSSGHGLTIQWNGNPNYGYQIFIRQENTTVYSLVYSGSISPVSIVSSKVAVYKYYIGNLSSNTLYYIRVRSIHIPSGKVSIFAEVLARTVFNQSDFENQQQKLKEEEQNRIRDIQNQKQVTIVLENSSDKYYLYINDQNALDEIQRINSNEFVIDFTKALYSSAKGQVLFSYKVADALEKLQKNFVLRYKSSMLKLPPGALNVSEIENISKRYGIDKGLVMILIELSSVSVLPPSYGYDIDSDVMTFKVTARYYQNDEQVVSSFAKPVNITLKLASLSGQANQTRAVYDFSNSSFVTSFSTDSLSNSITFNVEKPGTFGVLKTQTVSSYTLSKYKDDIAYVVQKYNLNELYNDFNKNLSQDYATKLITRVFGIDVDKVRNGNLTRQEAIYILARVYEQKTSSSIDNVVITKSTSFVPDGRYKKFILAMMSLGIVDNDFDPYETIKLDEFVHYIVNLEKILKY
ncbi:Fibronectin type III domain protein [Caldicellulosiruptor kronotskyensis 2002]|uniref:Fibronectin type III domain protein n=1 Tax=Caldicellulosiruptor kronotskyensis (strain DSM 18902 / VKM B-2412 / 2002) TaxID=632348 RepID=E4SF01_CALK2|nr:fibronectin type III domain-containing protein [Caldicellulosiruptor kronotskyensis]ADQ45638.1 Fibronectin type III domain protein [Caldicellulosiruptor kronotskyensis 2002]